MVMKKMINIISITVMVLFSGCKSENPTVESIVGGWVAENGAVIELFKDGTFSTENLTGDKIFPYENEYKGKAFTEKGTWKIGDDKGLWVVYLYFKKSVNLPKGYSTQILISGSKGIMENQPPWYLFLWEGEEGGSRYKFSKKN